MKKNDLVEIYNVEFMNLRKKINDLRPGNFNQSLAITQLKHCIDDLDHTLIMIYKDVLYDEEGGLK